jgi:hypothetical protein
MPAYMTFLIAMLQHSQMPIKGTQSGLAGHVFTAMWTRRASRMFGL